MVSATGLNTNIGIVESAARVIKSQGTGAAAGVLKNLARDIVVDNTANVLNNRAKFAERLDRAGSSIASFSSQTTIMSRMFIDESLLGEAVIPHLTKSFHGWYAAQIISALGLSQMVASGVSVQDVLGLVQTGHSQRQGNLIGNLFQKRMMAQESFLQNYSGEKFLTNNIGLEAYTSQYPSYELNYGNDSKASDKEKIAHDKAVRDQIKFDRDQEDRADKKRKDDEEAYRKYHTRDISVKSVNVSDNRIGPMGELFEVKIANPNGTGISITVPVFIQMQPTLIPHEVAPRFVDLNVEPTTWQRWTMWRAGEISFFKDFIMQHDRIKRNQSLLKDPELAKAFGDFQKTIARKDKYVLDDLSGTASSTSSANLANSVMVLSEDAVHQAKLDSGIDLHNAADRHRYFRQTYTMILSIVDPLHQRVTIYFNGMDGDLNVSYNEFRPNDKNFDPKDFMTALQAFSSNNIARMR